MKHCKNVIDNIYCITKADAVEQAPASVTRLTHRWIGWARLAVRRSSTCYHTQHSARVSIHMKPKVIETRNKH